MERFKRTFSFKKKKDHVPEASKPHQWQEDEKKVRDATCSFQVRYLGCIEVFESRGIQVCEEAVKALKSRQQRSVWARMSLRKKKSKDQQCKGKYQRAILYVSGDALRVVDEISKGLIVDQTIEKVSFCAPDRNHEKGFAYICRDGTTRRWMCHGFLAVKESGERLSHAVGCAFAICLEKKQKREKDAVTVTYNDKGTSFSRMGSFRQATLTERMQDPQSVIIADPVDNSKADSTSQSESVAAATGGGIDNYVVPVQRPRASEELLQRQASFRGFSKLSDSSPFKRQLSLRLNELPSNLARQQQLQFMGHSLPSTNGAVVETIAEVSPSKEEDHISDLRQQIEGLSAALHTNDNNSTSSIPTRNAQPQSAPSQHLNSNNTITSTGQRSNIPSVEPIRQTNPWQTPPAFRHNSPAESWLMSAATSVSGSPGSANQPAAAPTTNGAPAVATGSDPATPHHGNVNAPPGQPAQKAPMISSTQLRSQTVDSADAQWYNQQRAPTLRELQHRNQLPNFKSEQQATAASPAPAIATPPQQPPQPAVNQTTATQVQQRPVQPQTSAVVTSGDPWSSAPLGPTSTDPFDAAWATKSPNIKQQQQAASSNPFHGSGGGGGDSVSQTFKLQL